jgi:hypothetical protein
MADITSLFELLENAGLISGSGIHQRRVWRLSAGQISDIGAQAAVLTRAESLPCEVGNMTHSAMLSLGGGTEPYASVSCRLRHVDQLAQFAAFYSDRVYIHNFLSNHEHQLHSEYSPSLKERRHTLLNDVDGCGRPRDTRVSQERRALQAPVAPGLMATAIGHRRHPGVCWALLS